MHDFASLSNSLNSQYIEVRSLTERLVEELSDADCTAQSMEDASPAKWHLAHTTWFWETFLLEQHSQSYVPFNPSYGFLFNSYYNAVGEKHPRPKRGLLTRPSLKEVISYRQYVDREVLGLLSKEIVPEVADIVRLGLAHEQQHQELLLTDILHLFAQNPTQPAYRFNSNTPTSNDRHQNTSSWIEVEGGLVTLGASEEAFAFDCETPAHKVFLESFQLAQYAVTNSEWIEFISDGGYATPSLWLSDGWEKCNQEYWRTPLYWESVDGEWLTITLHGSRLLDLNAPVTNISFYEADAFATWAGARLPTEFEWEHAARSHQHQNGQFLDLEKLTYSTPRITNNTTFACMYGNVWEWTSSPFRPYPGFKVASGAVGEYNGKFMSGQYVLKGGSLATPYNHIRASYRNFFHPEKRWQFSGLRLAK